MTGTEPGWHPDPHDPNLQRYWDGDAWTTQTRAATTNPILPIAAPATRANSPTPSRTGPAGASRRRDGVVSRAAVMDTPGEDASAMLLVTPLQTETRSGDFIMGDIPDIPVTQRTRRRHTWWWMIGLYLVILAAALTWWRGQAGTGDVDPTADVPRVVSARPVAPYLVGAQPLVVGTESARTAELVSLIDSAAAPQFAADYGPDPYQWGRTLTVFVTEVASTVGPAGPPVDLTEVLQTVAQATSTSAAVTIEEPGFGGQQWCQEGTRGSDIATACSWSDGRTVVLMVVGLPLIEATVPMELVLQSLSRPQSGADAVAPDDDPETGTPARPESGSTGDPDGEQVP